MYGKGFYKYGCLLVIVFFVIGLSTAVFLGFLLQLVMGFFGIHIPLYISTIIISLLISIVGKL